MGWFITITEEMRQWGLSGNELLVFALINGYSQKAQGCYWGGIEFTCQVCGISRATAIRTLQSLTDKGFISKTKILLKDKVRTIYIASRVSKCDTESQNETSEGIKMTPNNKDININNSSLYKERSPKFQKPSLAEISDYCINRGNKVDPEQFYNFYESNGWMVGKNHMKDWHAAIRTWEKREKEIPQRKRSAVKRESVFEHNLKVMDQMYGTNLHEQAYGRQADEQ